MEQKNRVSILVLLDISSAFDTVDHKLLLNTLERCFGIRDMALKLHTSYLAERTKTFQVRTDKSNTYAVNCSVPQGSVLGLKYLAYTEDLPPVVEEHNYRPISLRRQRTTERSSFAVRRRRRDTKDGELCGCCAQMNAFF